MSISQLFLTASMPYIKCELAAKYGFPYCCLSSGYVSVKYKNPVVMSYLLFIFAVRLISLSLDSSLLYEKISCLECMLGYYFCLLQVSKTRAKKMVDSNEEVEGIVVHNRRICLYPCPSWALKTSILQLEVEC